MEFHPDRQHNHDKQEYASEQFKKAKSFYDDLLQAKLQEDKSKSNSSVFAHAGASATNGMRF